MKKSIASVLAAALILTSPGGLVVEAAAQHFAAMKAPPAAPVAIAPAAIGGGLRTAPLALPAQTLAPSLRTIPIPGVVNAVTQQAALPSAAAAPIAQAAAATASPSAGALPTAQSAPRPTASAQAVTARLAENPALTIIAKPDHETSPSEKGLALDRLFDSSRSEGPFCEACPFTGRTSKPAAPAAAREGALAPAPGGPVTPDTHPELFRPRSSRTGVGPVKYVWWNSFYNVMQWFNVTLARNPNRRVSWDKWPTALGLVYLLSKIRFLRAGTLTDPYDYAANDTQKAGQEPDAAKRGYTADGKWVSDKENPQMGQKDTRFGSNIPPQQVRPDVENMTPSSREVGKLRWRLLSSETGKDI